MHGCPAATRLVDEPMRERRARALPPTATEPLDYPSLAAGEQQKGSGLKAQARASMSLAYPVWPR
jgi:hypothetical protein